jgi:hypothetical protein
VGVRWCRPPLAAMVTHLVTRSWPVEIAASASASEEHDLLEGAVLLDIDGGTPALSVVDKGQ